MSPEVFDEHVSLFEVDIAKSNAKWGCSVVVAQRISKLKIPGGFPQPAIVGQFREGLLE